MNPIGRPKAELETPFLWLALDAFERNVRMMVEFFRKAGVSWRPHVKGIKVPAVAHRLVEAGAIGVTCAHLNEARGMVECGIRDVLIANQVVGESKALRLALLNRQARVMPAVDSIENARELSCAATRAGAVVGAVIEVNIGMDRCGVAPGEPVVELARQVADLPGFRLAGVMGWEGHAVGIKEPEEKSRQCRAAIAALVRSAEMCRAAGLAVPIVSCGGSGTFRITTHEPGVTEIQAGGAVFGDLSYQDAGAGVEGALFLTATVVSRPEPGRAVMDAGVKCLNAAVTRPRCCSLPTVRVAHLNAEHGILALEDPSVLLKVGDRLDLAVGYGDFTVFMHDHLYGVRNGLVDAAWEIPGRGN